MFENKFNSKKTDPLVEAVKQAQQDGELRRQAEAIVNEQFGVYNRNAVVREDLAGYDISVETVYQDLKEGKKLAGKDYDQDGKVESPKDEVWGSRLRAAKMAGKMEEGLDVVKRDPSVQGSGDVTKSAPKEDPSLPKSYPGAASSAPTAARLGAAKAAVTPVKEESLDEVSDKLVRSYAKKAFSDMKSAANFGDTMSIRNRAKGIALASKKNVGDAKVPSTGPKKDYLVKEESLDEVSKGAAISAYREKEAQERDTDKLHGLIKRKWGKETAKHAERAGAQSSVGLVRRGEDRGKEDSIARDRRHPRDRITKSGKVHKQDTATLKGNIKRRLGSHTRPGHLPEEQMDEAKYSYKSARAGKDIGKRGKTFDVIAKKAGEKYGSEERGRKVAGAVLKAIRAKRMEEDSSF